MSNWGSEQELEEIVGEGNDVMSREEAEDNVPLDAVPTEDEDE